MEDNYAVKRKGADGKYFTFGNVKKNQYGNFGLGMKVTPQLKELVASTADGQWVNWNMFADDGERGAAKPEAPKPVQAAVVDDEICF